MKTNGYCIYDKKARSYNAPIFLANDEVAIRDLRTVVENAGSMLAKFPDDFLLCKVCEFDSATGSVVPLPPEPVFELRDLFVAVSGATVGAEPPQAASSAPIPSETA